MGLELPRVGDFGGGPLPPATVLVVEGAPVFVMHAVVEKSAELGMQFGETCGAIHGANETERLDLELGGGHVDLAAGKIQGGRAPPRYPGEDGMAAFPM